MIGVIEAKAAYRSAADGLQQAKEYAQTLGVKFAYATNGKSILEHNFLTGKESELQVFPSPEELWNRIRESEGIKDEVVAARILRQVIESPVSRYDTTKRSPSIAPSKQ